MLIKIIRIAFILECVLVAMIAFAGIYGSYLVLIGLYLVLPILGLEFLLLVARLVHSAPERQVFIYLWFTILFLVYATLYAAYIFSEPISLVTQR